MAIYTYILKITAILCCEMSSNIFRKSIKLFFLVSCSADMTVKLWDFQGFDCVKTMHGKCIFLLMDRFSVHPRFPVPIITRPFSFRSRSQCFEHNFHALGRFHRVCVQRQDNKNVGSSYRVSSHVS